MTGSHQPRRGLADLPGGQHDHVADLRDVVVRLPDRDEATGGQASVIHVGNVVPFARSRHDATPARQAPDIPFKPAERPAPFLTDRRRNLFVAFLAVSVASHSTLYFLFNREPSPMASIGIEAISVELVLGDNRQAGVAQTPGQSVANTPAAAPDPLPADTQTATADPDMVQEAKPVEARTVTADQPPDIKPEPAPAVIAPEPAPERVAQTAQQTAALPVEEAPAVPEPELAVAPEVSAQPKPAEPPKPQPTRTETRPEPQPKPKPVETRETKRKTEPAAKRKQERPGPVSRTASTVQDATGPRAQAAGGVGIGRSEANSNYPGIVRAHLARYQRNNHSSQGKATVRFGLDGGGRVTTVALVSGTGNAALDQEAQAMVRRASPFPAPPPGAPRSFTVPVRFSM